MIAWIVLAFVAGGVLSPIAIGYIAGAYLRQRVVQVLRGATMYRVFRPELLEHWDDERWCFHRLRFARDREAGGEAPKKTDGDDLWFEIVIANEHDGHHHEEKEVVLS